MEWMDCGLIRFSVYLWGDDEDLPFIQTGVKSSWLHQNEIITHVLYVLSKYNSPF